MQPYTVTVHVVLSACVRMQPCTATVHVCSIECMCMYVAVCICCDCTREHVDVGCVVAMVM